MVDYKLFNIKKHKRDKARIVIIKKKLCFKTIKFPKQRREMKFTEEDWQHLITELTCLLSRDWLPTPFQLQHQLIYCCIVTNSLYFMQYPDDWFKLILFNFQLYEYCHLLQYNNLPEFGNKLKCIWKRI